LLGLAGESIGVDTAARQWELRLELPLLEALLLARMSGHLRRPTDPDLGHMSGPTDQDLRSLQLLMARQAMATAQDPTRTLRS
jgi:hypothetical protein